VVEVGPISVSCTIVLVVGYCTVELIEEGGKMRVVPVAGNRLGNVVPLVSTGVETVICVRRGVGPGVLIVTSPVALSLGLLI